MAEQSWPFYQEETGGTEVLEDQWSIMARQWAPTGVVGQPSGAALQVYADGSAREVYVRTGRATVRGHWYTQDTDNVTVTIAANTSGNPRIDVVALVLDPTADAITVDVVQGTPAASPAVPALTRTDLGVYQFPLAYVAVANAAAVTAAAAVTDVRQYTGFQVVPCLSTARPYNPPVGQVVYETNTGRFTCWTGTVWRPLDGSAHGNTVVTSSNVGTAHIDLPAGQFAAAPTYISITAGSQGSAENRGVNWWVADGTNPALPAPTATRFHIGGLPFSQAVRIFWEAKP